MKRTAEIALFGGIAALIHVSLFAAAPQTGVRSSGAGGEALVSLQASSATVAQMVEAWERPPPRPPMVQPALERPLTPPEAPQMPQLELAQAPQVAVQVALAQPDSSDVVEVDLSTPPPPPEPEPEPEPKPDPEPEPKPTPRPKPPQKPAPKPPVKQVPKQSTEGSSQRTSAGQAAQRAAGSGGGARAGTSGGSQSATLAAGQREKLRAVWGAKIPARIERRKRYPSGQHGKARVIVSITVATNGTLVNSRIARSSGVAAFDQAALRAVARAGRFPAAPKRIRGKAFTYRLPMDFSK